jgi:hypothetical protein
MVILAVFALSVVGSEWSSSKPSGERIEWWPAVLLEGVACAALWWRRSHPRTVVAVTASCVNTGTVAGYPIRPLLLGPVMIALYRLAIRTSRATARIGLFGVSALVVPTAVLADHYDHPLFFRTVGPVFWLLVPVAWGTTARLRGAYLEAVHARAEHAERTRDEQARHRVAEERMCASRASCTMSSPTTSRWPTPWPGPPRTSPAAAPTRRGGSWATSPTPPPRRYVNSSPFGGDGETALRSPVRTVPGVCRDRRPGATGRRCRFTP